MRTNLSSRQPFRPLLYQQTENVEPCLLRQSTKCADDGRFLHSSIFIELYDYWSKPTSTPKIGNQSIGVSKDNQARNGQARLTLAGPLNNVFYHVRKGKRAETKICHFSG